MPVSASPHMRWGTAPFAPNPAGIDCIEHGFLASDDTIKLMVDTARSWCPPPI